MQISIEIEFPRVCEEKVHFMYYHILLQWDLYWQKGREEEVDH